MSYCWGGPQEVQLTKNTIEPFKNSIQIDSLPKTLRDAAAVTRRLRKKYLWVDALCIIQDDEASKQKELAQMARIYMNSFLTIQAAVPSSVKEGFLESREPPEIPPVQMCFSRDKDGGGEIYAWAGLPYGGKPDANTRWPSTQRSWIFQESVLPVRILVYAHNQAYVSCRHGAAHEDGDQRLDLAPMLLGPRTYREINPQKSPLEITSDAATGEVSKAEKSHDPPSAEDRSIRRAWYTCITNYYSGRVQQVSEDRLNALGAFAGEAHRVIGGQYLAGLWSIDLIAGLHWYRGTDTTKTNHSYTNYLTKATSYRAPSWSWAAYDGLVEFQSYDQISEYQLPGLEIVDTWTTKTGLSPYGACSDGEVILKTLVSTASVRRTADRQIAPLIADDGKFRPSHKESIGYHPLFAPQDPEDVKKDLCMTIYDTADEVNATVTCAFLTLRSGLVLVEVNRSAEGQKQFQRIGLFKCRAYRRYNCDDLVRFETWRQSCKFEKISLV